MQIVVIDFVGKIVEVLSVFIVPAFAIACCMSAVRYFIFSKKEGIWGFLLWVVYLVLIIGETIIRRIGTVKETTDLLGFAQLWQNPWFVVAAVENIVMFLPFGAFFRMAYGSRKKSCLLCCAVTVLLCFCIELVQYIFVIGEAELLDIICNLAGSILGYGIIGIFLKARKKNGT